MPKILNPTKRYHCEFLFFYLYQISCCSSVGRQSPIQPQNISIAPHCESKGTVLHEIAHALGFWHEQSRPDRENYVNVAFSNVLRANQYNFYKKPAHEVDSLGEPYDYDSIMHYHNFALAKDESKETITPIQCCPRPIIGQRVKPSVGDVTQMNKLYKCPCMQHYFTFYITIAFALLILLSLSCLQRKCTFEVLFI
ncbi:unnamed protein product [Schistocephalus solidus]|uniref:Metalloendopeptidase n=1 Tax=Schistocephalus solidus TaxID=70667 RepID=A0A183SNS4_SCHSO|nr:unnamed protein product [Schistocephalus solidus]